MNPVTLRRVAIVGCILAVLLALDGIVMAVTNYKPDDTSSNIFHLSDGGTVLVAAALVLVLSIIAFIMSNSSKSATASVIVNEQVDTAPAEPEVNS